MKRFAWMVVFCVLLLPACGANTATTPIAPATSAPPGVSPAATAATGGTTTTQTTAATEGTTTTQTFAIVPEESKVSYTVNEVFLREGVVNATAIGVTQIISGAVSFDRSNPQNSQVGPITIDISAFKSDRDRRDSAIRERWLESARYPLATFVPTEISGLPTTYTDGQEITLQITGDMTVRDITKPVTFETVGSINGNEMRGTATTSILMTDFGFNPPDILNVLRAENDVLLTFDFVARTQ